MFGDKHRSCWLLDAGRWLMLPAGEGFLLGLFLFVVALCFYDRVVWCVGGS